MASDFFVTPEPPPQPDSACDPFAAASAACKAASQAQDDKSKTGPNETKTESAFGKALIGQDSKPAEQPPASQTPQAGELKLIEIPEGGDIVPPSQDQYILPGEEAADKGLASWYRETAYKLGLTKRQTAHLMQFHSQKLAEYQAEANRATQATHVETTTELKNLWGDNLQANLTAISEATAKMSDSAYNALISRLLHAHFAASSS